MYDGDDDDDGGGCWRKSDLNVVFSLSGCKETDNKEKLLLLLEYFGFFFSSSFC